MPYDPEIDEEVVDAAPVAIAPPATVVQQAHVPVYANDVYEGPKTFKTFTGYQAAWERARDEAMAQRAQDAQLRDVLANSTAVEDQLKAINQAKQFIQMRKFGSDLQAATASGLPPEQALATSLARNPGAVLGNMAASAGAFRNAGRAMQPQVPLGETKVITDPGTGKRVGIAMRRGDGSMQFIPDRSNSITPSQRLGGLRTKAQILSDQIKNTPIGQDSIAPSAELKSVISQIDKIIADEKPAEIPNPVAQPIAQPVQVKVPAGYVAVVNTQTGEKKMVKESNASKISSDSFWKLVK